jgi:hypothetical protein
VAAVTGILFAGAFVVTLVGAGGGCSVNTAGITDPGSGLDGIGGSGSESRGGVGGNISILTGTGGAVSTGAGGARDGTGGSGDGNGNGGATGAGGAISGSGGATDGMGGAHEGAGGMQAGTGGTNDGTGGTGMGGAPGMGGRGMGGTPGMGGAGMGGMPGMGGAPGTGGMISVIGCADGTREAFVNVNTFPSIAGCDGAWSVAGVVSMASMTPACNRAAGNNGTLRNGTGCTVADLCAVGWHVCGGANELDALNVTCAQAGLPNGNGTAAQVLYATRQRGVIGTTCNANDMLNIDTNDVHGCGNTGLAEDRNCAPLNAQFSHTECDDLGPPWSCPGTLTEGLTVVKSSSANGGVLCCK